MSADLWPAPYRVNLALKQVYVLMSNGHIHVWRMHKERSPTLMSVWDKLTPNHKDLALSMTLVPRGQLHPPLAEMQGEQLLEPSACSVPWAYSALFSKTTKTESVFIIVIIMILT